MSQSPLQLSGNGHSPLMQWDQLQQEWGAADPGMVNAGLTDQPENVTAGINGSRESLQDFITKHAMMEVWPVPLSPERPESFLTATRNGAGVLFQAQVIESSWTRWFCRRGRLNQDDGGQQGWVVYNVLGWSKQRIKIICLSNKAALQVTIVSKTPKGLLNQLFILLSSTDAMNYYRVFYFGDPVKFKSIKTPNP